MSGLRDYMLKYLRLGFLFIRLIDRKVLRDNAQLVLLKKHKKLHIFPILQTESTISDCHICCSLIHPLSRNRSLTDCLPTNLIFLYIFHHLDDEFTHSHCLNWFKAPFCACLTFNAESREDFCCVWHLICPDESIS